MLVWRFQDRVDCYLSHQRSGFDPRVLGFQVVLLSSGEQMSLEFAREVSGFGRRLTDGV